MDQTTRLAHTDGPWHVTGTPTMYHQEHISTDDGFCVATVHQPEQSPFSRHSRETLLANSNLIRRAPDMYAALRAIADMRLDAHTKPTELLAMCVAMARHEATKAKPD